MFNLFKKRQKTTTSASVASTTKANEAKQVPQAVKPAASRLVRTTMAVGALLLLGALGASGYFYKQLSDIKKNPTDVAAKKSQQIIAAVGKHIVLPTDEEPTLASVSDPAKLKNQPFFANAQVGDNVLIYANAKLAILYSSTLDKIVAVAPVNIGDTQEGVSGASTEKSPKK